MQQGASTRVRIVFVARGTHNLENRIPYRDQELFQRHVDRSQQARQAGRLGSLDYHQSAIAPCFCLGRSYAKFDAVFRN